VTPSCQIHGAAKLELTEEKDELIHNWGARAPLQRNVGVWPRYAKEVTYRS